MQETIKKINQIEPCIGEDEKRAVIEYMDSGGWLTEFKKTREFENMIADYTGSKYAVVVSNGTVSLSIALMALGVKGKDEVIVPDYTMIASANSVILAGAKPVLVDIDGKNLCLSLDNLERVLTPNTKAIMLVTINGRYPEIERFVEFAKRHDLFLIEDAAQSLGARYKGKHLGTFGDVGSFSFSMPKIVTTGQGGCLITDSEELYRKILKIKDFGRTKSGVDYHETMGYNFKFTDLQAAIGIEQMKKIDERVKRKKEIYKLYRDSLKSIKGIEFIDTNLDDTPPWFMDIMVGADKRDALAESLGKNGIGTRPFYPAIHTQPPYAFIKGDFKNSETASLRGIWLPSSVTLNDGDIAYVCEAIKKFFRNLNEAGH